MSVVMLKYCGKCRRFKSRCAFAKDRRAKDGLRSRCKDCNAATDAAYYAERRDDPEYRAKRRERSAAYHAERRDDPDYRAKRRERSAAYHAERRDDPEFLAKERERSARYRAERRDDPEFLAKARERNARYERTKRDNSTPARRAAKRRRRARQANAPHSPYDVAAYYGLPCYECGEPATVADHVFPLSRPGPLTWDAPWNLLPHCGTHSSRKSNKPPVWYWGQHHRAFDVVRLIQDDASWFDSEPDWAHVAAGF